MVDTDKVKKPILAIIPEQEPESNQHIVDFIYSWLKTARERKVTSITIEGIVDGEVNQPVTMSVRMDGSLVISTGGRSQTFPCK